MESPESLKASKPSRNKQQWTALLALIASYVLLVALVVGAGAWLKKEFDDAQNERCQLLASNVLLVQTQLDQLPVDDQLTEKLKNQVVKLQAQLELVCEDLI